MPRPDLTALNTAINTLYGLEIGVRDRYHYIATSADLTAVTLAATTAVTAVQTELAALGLDADCIAKRQALHRTHIEMSVALNFAKRAAELLSVAAARKKHPQRGPRSKKRKA